MADSVGSGGGPIDEDRTPKLEEYIEIFLIVLIILNVQRREKPTAKRYILVLASKFGLRNNTLMAYWPYTNIHKL